MIEDAQAAGEDAADKALEAAKGYTNTVVGDLTALGADAEGNPYTNVVAALADNEKVTSEALNVLNTTIGTKEGEGAPTGLYKEIADAETAAKTEARDLSKALEERLEVLDEVAGVGGEEGKTVSERLDVVESGLTAHTQNAGIHVTTEDKGKWNTAVSDLDTHTKNTDIHVTTEDKGNWDKAVSDINAFLSETGATEALDSLKELQDWITTHGDQAANLATGVTANTNAIKDIQDEIGVNEGEGAPTGLYKEIADAETAAKEYTDTVVGAASIKDAEGNVTSAATGVYVAIEAETAARTSADEGFEARIKSIEENVTTKAHEHENKAELDKVADGDVAKWNEAATKAHEHSNKAELDKIADGDVEKWNGIEKRANDYTDEKLGNYAEVGEGGSVAKEATGVRAEIAERDEAVLEDAKKYTEDRLGTLPTTGEGEEARSMTVAEAIAAAKADVEGDITALSGTPSGSGAYVTVTVTQDKGKVTGVAVSEDFSELVIDCGTWDDQPEA
jgi:hypothetical protein